MLSLSSRRGFSLVEIAVAMGLSLIVSAAVYQLLVTTQRLTRAQSEHLALQSTVRSAVLVVLNELRELNTSAGAGPERNDVLSGSATALTYRAGRGFGLICQPPTATQVRISRRSFAGARDPQPGRDSAYVFVEGDVASDQDDLWQPLAITGVSTSAACGGTLEPGITLAVPATGSLVGLAAGTPVRIGEIMELRLYQAEGNAWLGMRSVSTGEAIQPLAGPLATDGLRLQYLDGNGHSTVDLSAVSRVSVIVRGIGGHSAVPPANALPLSEELMSEVVLRNSASR